MGEKSGLFAVHMLMLILIHCLQRRSVSYQRYQLSEASVQDVLQAQELQVAIS